MSDSGELSSVRKFFSRDFTNAAKDVVAILGLEADVRKAVVDKHSRKFLKPRDFGVSRLLQAIQEPSLRNINFC